MTFLLIGVNHNSAPIEVRERLALPEPRLPEAMQQLAKFPGVEEGLILSTCNRVELLANATNGSADLRGFLREYFKINPAEYEKHLYEYREAEAIRHLFRVTSSLDSMVVGEPQILGQVKEAYAMARAVGAVHSQLDALISRSFAVAKRVRTETAVGSSAVSVASIAVELAKKIFGSLQGRNVYVVGAGKMSTLAARYLRSHGAATIFVSNRSHERAQQMASAIGGTAIHFDQLYSTADQADIVVTSTGAPHAIFRREHGEIFMQRRKNRPMFFIDIAVPRDVDPAMSAIDGIFVYDIDDLQHVVEANASDRGREAQRAEAIIEQEVSRFERRVQSLDAVPTIIALQQRLDAIRQTELDRLRGRLGRLTPEQEAVVESLTRGIVNKILHSPVSALKAMSGSEQLASVADLVRSLFGIHDVIVSQNGMARLGEEAETDIGPAQLPKSVRKDTSETPIVVQKFISSD